MIPALAGTSVHRLMKLAAHGAFIVLATGVPTEGTPQAPKQSDTWVNPGVSVGASTDPTKFVNTTDAGFIGVLERLSVGFVDDKQEWLFTTMTFRVTEVVFSKLSIRPGDRIEVITRGGWYEEKDGKRVPTRPADITEGLQRGGEYFVPVTLEQRPGTAWTGKTGLSSLDALLRLENGELSPVQRHSKWPAGILSHAHVATNLPGPSPTRRTLFLATLRSAAQSRR
jgi:hypothetical protein